MRVLVFGEVLWDVFPNEKAIGGAPLNFAAHLLRLGCNARIVSAVGNDELGQETLATLRRLGLDTSYVSVIPRPTGIAQVTLDEDGTPTYELVRDVAYDFIPFPPALRQAHPFDAIYFGTLAQRNPLPRATLAALLELTQGALRFCDLNLRQSFYSREVVESCLQNVNVLKISRDEASAFRELGLSDVAITGRAEDVQTLGRDLHSRYPNLRELLLTLDKDGASVWLSESDEMLISEKPNVRVVSTVGGGDSFGACYLFNRLTGASPSVALKRGQVLAGYVVTQLGAVPQYPSELYKRIK